MTNELRTAVCCLCSLNLDTYDEWKDTTIVADLIRFLDNVLEYFIVTAPKELQKAIYSAKQERALGLGTFGFHSYLQRKGVAFESGGVGGAASLNYRIYSDIKEKAEQESKRLAKLRGEPNDCKGSGFRNSCLLAIAPNANSADILGVSPSIEPLAGNAYVSQGRAGSFLIKNLHLSSVLEKYGQNTAETWDSIVSNDGSVQHLAFLTEQERNVFKTGKEINPMWIVEHAATRQPMICQSQSVNIKVGKDITKQEMSDIHMKAWMKGLKTLYYCRSEAATKAKIGDGSNAPLNSVVPKIEFTECLSCEG